jgi:hypothetical protein
MANLYEGKGEKEKVVNSRERSKGENPKIQTKVLQ